MLISHHEWSSVSSLIILWLFFAVTPSLRADDVKTVIDDTDPQIQYNGSWSHVTGNIFYNSTESVTQVAGSTATYAFNGTGISVFGTQCNRPGVNTTTVSSYSIDSKIWSKYTQPFGVNCPQNFFNFYTSPPLENGNHTLVITNLNDGLGYFLDYLEVMTPASSSPPASSSSSGSASNGATSRRSNKGAIVGSALGAAAFMAIFFLAMLSWRKLRKKSQKSQIGAMAQTAGDPECITAFVIPHYTATSTNQAGDPRADAANKISASTSTLPSPFTAGNPNPDGASPSLVFVTPRQTTAILPPAYSTGL